MNNPGMNRSARRGQAIPVILLVLVVGLIVGGLRYFKLGDLPFSTKLIETMFWGMGTVVIGLVLAGVTSVIVRQSEMMATPRRREGGARAVTPEELSAIESEVSEKERPEFGGVHGRPPEEMAEMIRKMAGGDDV